MLMCLSRMRAFSCGCKEARSSLVRFGMLHRHASHCVCCGGFFLETYRPLAIGCLRTQKHALSLIPVPAGFRLSCFVKSAVPAAGFQPCKPVQTCPSRQAQLPAMTTMTMRCQGMPNELCKAGRRSPTQKKPLLAAGLD